MSDQDYMEVYTVIEGKDGQQDYWQRIGRAYHHRNSDGGLNVYLNALPLNGKLVIKPKKKNDE